MKLVIFDFCDTLVRFQSADAFIRFIWKKGQIRASFLFSIVDRFFQWFKVYTLLYKLGIHKDFERYFLLWSIKGISKEKLMLLARDFETTVIKNQLNPNVIALLENHLRQGDEVVLNSGGYDVYLQVFAERFGITKFFGTRFVYQKQQFSGRILGEVCLKEEKIKRMYEEGISLENYTEISVYSDSITDMPLFNIANKKYAVIKGSRIPEWCDNDMFEVIFV